MRLMFDVVDEEPKEVHIEGSGKELLTSLGGIVTTTLVHMGGDKETSSGLYDFFVKMLEDNKETILNNAMYRNGTTS